MNSVILKHVSVFALKQPVTRILSNKYIWLLLKYKTDELGTHSDLRQKNKNKQLHCLAIPFIVSVNSNKKVLHYWNIVISEKNSLFYSCKLENNVKVYQQLFLLALNSINQAIS